MSSGDLLNPLTVQLPKGPAEFRIVGIGGAGKEGDKSSGSRNLFVLTEEAQQLLGIEGKYSSIR